MNSNSPSIAFFDVDYTILDGSSGYYTTLRLIKHGIIKKRRMIQAAYYLAAGQLFNQDIKKIYQIAINDMAGSTIERILEIGRECFENDIKPRLLIEAIARVKEHQEKGDHVVLLTAGPYMTIKILQDFLGIHEAYTMGPEVVDGILINKLRAPICHGEGKVHFAKLSSQKHNIPLSQCSFYSDHITDLPLLEQVGNPCVVNPERKLKRAAKSRGWNIHRFVKRGI